MASFIEKARHFFQVAVFPELLGKFFSRPSDSASSTLDEVIALLSTMSSVHAVCDDLKYTMLSVHGTSEDDNRNEVYCYCQKGESGNMMGSDSPECQYGWFHFSYLKLSSTPKNKKWFALIAGNYLLTERKLTNNNIIAAIITSFFYQCKFKV